MVASVGTEAIDASQLIQLSLKNFISSFDKSDKDFEKKIEEKVKGLISSADKDKNGSLSKDELSAINTKDNPELAKAVNSLINGFATYDSNNDKELSAGELKDAFKKLNKEFSLQDIAKIAKEHEEFKNSEKFANFASHFVSSMADKLISGYDKVKSLTTSSLGVEC